MKIVISNWHFGSKIQALIEKLGYRHNEEFEVPNLQTVFEIVEQFLNEGLNIMILKREDGYILGVDTKRFQQR